MCSLALSTVADHVLIPSVFPYGIAAHKVANATLSGPSVVNELVIGSILGSASGGLWKMHHQNEQRKTTAFYDLHEKVMPGSRSRKNSNRIPYSHMQFKPQRMHTEHCDIKSSPKVVMRNRSASWICASTPLSASSFYASPQTSERPTFTIPVLL